MDNEKKWFIIHTYSGYENKVQANINRKVQALGLDEEIFRVVIPMIDEFEFKNGIKKNVKKKVFPGYMLVEMIVTDRSWHAVRNTPGVTGFVGSGGKPVPLTTDEANKLLRSMGIDAKQFKADWQVDEVVHVIAGGFEGAVGKVVHVNAEKGKLKVLIDIFGRETPVELEFAQVQKMT